MTLGLANANDGNVIDDAGITVDALWPHLKCPRPKRSSLNLCPGRIHEAASGVENILLAGLSRSGADRPQSIQ